jgi:tRNA (cytidine/uridine-2'-O-)-methyltransferase
MRRRSRRHWRRLASPEPRRGQWLLEGEDTINTAWRLPGCAYNSPMHVVLVHPEIHWNTGNAGRTCLAVGATLHLIEPLGFSLDERQVKRAGLDYWEFVDLRVWRDWATFERVLPSLGQSFFFSTRAPRLLWDAPLDGSGDIVLIFGRETGGLPADLHERYADRFVTVPILSPHVRSLNLSTAVGIAAYEVLRQRQAGGAGKPLDPPASMRTPLA